MQVEEFLKNEVAPVLEAHKDDKEMDNEINV